MITGRRIASLLAAAAAASLMAAPATADTITSGEVTVTGLDGAAANGIAIKGLFPGSSDTVQYLVGTSSGAPTSRLLISLDNVRDLERGCNRPERNSGDDTCEELEGELARDLLLSAVIADNDDCDNGTTEVLPATTLRSLADSEPATLLSEALPPGVQRCLTLDFELPSSSNNHTQTDAVTFDLTIVAESDLDNPQVLGEVEVRGDAGAAAGQDGDTVLAAGDTVTGPLPMTGSDVLVLAAAAVLLLVLGGAALRADRRRSSPST